jgi:hypothetical protein
VFSTFCETHHVSSYGLFSVPKCGEFDVGLQMGWVSAPTQIPP